MTSSIPFKETLALVRQLGWWRGKTFVILSLYLILTAGNAAFDGVSVVVLVQLITGHSPTTDSGPLFQILPRLFPSAFEGGSSTGLLFLVVLLFIARAILYFVVLAIDGMLSPSIRRRIQEKGFSQVIHGDWEVLRDIRVGQCVGALTEEAVILTKYLYSVIRLVYFAITSLVLIAIAVAVSPGLSTTMACFGLPMMLLFQWFFSFQARLSTKQMASRQGFTADVAERLAGIFQIKVGEQRNRHLQNGLRWQKDLLKWERRLGLWQAVTGSYEFLIPAAGLIVFYAWTLWHGLPFSGTLPLLAQVGVVGIRLLTQINGIIGSWGNLSRLSGSLAPVSRIFQIPGDPERAAVPDRLSRVEVRDVAYSYNGHARIEGVSFSAAKGSPLVIRGPSGSGKTTMANIISGLYRPHKGEVRYVDTEEKIYDARTHRARIGYVTQDIYLFNGTVRENLLPDGKAVTDGHLWKCLSQAGAKEFVSRMGGLDAPIVESGRSLSGGERRRLGISRALVPEPDILILDEMTAGLDEEKQREITQIIEELSQTTVIIAITHDLHEFLGWNRWQMEASFSAEI